MRTMSLDVERILDGHQFMRNSIKDETGGMGVDCIIDNGGKDFLFYEMATLLRQNYCLLEVDSACYTLCRSKICLS